MSVSHRTITGPRLRVEATCSDCEHVESEPYRVQGDSGHTVRCNHPRAPKKVIGDTNWTTPTYCPELERALREAGVPKLGQIR